MSGLVVRAHHERLGVPSNLPEALSSFVGRHDDLARVDELLSGTRLLTLTGSGGCGKTRLGREAAVAAAERFPDGVWWVDLTALTDGALAADELVRVLELAPDGRPATDLLVEHLGDAAALVVLDNCEHVADAVAAVVDGLLRGTCRLRVLATSRQPLEVDGETTWRVPSMTVPGDGVAPGDADAFRLFLERCAQAAPDATPTDEPDAVTRICTRLDGIPLAVELAAARVRTVGLRRIVDELDDRFRLLTGGPRQAPARHRTLRASVQWSYELLDPPHRTVLRRLAVFVGGFRAEAAEAVAGFAPLAPGSVLGLLADLVDRSLVQFDVGADRYRLLETIREYGREMLVDDGEAAAVADRHLDWACAFAQDRDPAMIRAEVAALDAVEAELPNLRAALDHAAGGGVAEPGLRLVAGLTFFWAQRGLGLEGADRGVRVLDARPDAPGHLRARARAAVAYDRLYGGDFETAVADADLGLTEATEAGDVQAQARCRHAHGLAALLLDPPGCRAAMAEAIELARSCGDHWCETDALQIFAFSHLVQHRPAPAHEPLFRSAERAAADGNAFQLACHHLGLGMTAAAAGRLAEAAIEHEFGADGAHRIGDPAIEIWGRAGQVTSALGRRRFADLTAIADAAAPPGRSVSPVVDAAAGLLHRIADAAGDAPAVLDALDELAELLRTTFVPNEGLRLALTAAGGALAHGDAARARASAELTLARTEEFGSALAGPCRVLLARLHRRDGEPVVAERLAHAGLGALLDDGLVVDLPDALEAVAGTAADLGNPATATRLLAAAAELRSISDVPGAFPTDADADRERLRAALGDDAFAARWAEGAGMDAATAAAFARRSRGERKRPASGWDALTPTELEVARLAADGLTNPAIGEAMFVSRATVKTHLEHVYAKLGIHNRAELAASFARRAGAADRG